MALVAFLRGINVGGHRRFRPSLLASELNEYGAVNIGAAGTLVICKQMSEKRLRSELLRSLPFDAQVMICTDEELIAAASNHPFGRKPPVFDIVRFVSVLANVPKALPNLPTRIPRNGKWLVRIVSVHGRFVFGYYRREMEAISCLGGIDKLFGAPATTRNWNTIGAILKVLER
jgi:uncharacterized protein (DUF1697 family)